MTGKNCWDKAKKIILIDTCQQLKQKFIDNFVYLLVTLNT